MGTVQLAMLACVPYTVLRDAVFAHPTMTEGLKAFICFRRAYLQSCCGTPLRHSSGQGGSSHGTFKQRLLAKYPAFAFET
jgi:hypothetical protein